MYTQDDIQGSSTLANEFMCKLATVCSQVGCGILLLYCAVLVRRGAGVWQGSHHMSLFTSGLVHLLYSPFQQGSNTSTVLTFTSRQQLTESLRAP